MAICILDDGSSQIKLKTANGETSLRFGSIVVNRAIYNADGVSESTYIVDGVDYTGLTTSDSPERTDTTNYQVSPLNRVLVHEALRQAGLGGQDVILGVTLPINQFFELGEDGRPNLKRIEQKKANLLGPIESKSGQALANIKEVFVFPEAIPAAVDTMTDLKDGKMVYKQGYSDNKRVCVIDVGGHSTDIVLFESQTANVLQQRGLETGVIKLVDSLQNKLANLMNESQAIERSIADQAFKDQAYAGHDLSNTIDQISAPLVQKIRATVEQLAPKRSTDLFLCVGGGANLVKSAIEDYAGEEKTIIPHQPDEAIARGVTKMLLAKLKKSENSSQIKEKAEA